MESPGQWAGGFRAWDAHGVYMATGRGATAGRVLQVPAERLAELADDWFPLGAHLLRGLVHTARNIESMARQREALVALGTLAAGLAHEINNPASAATRAVDALETTCDSLLSSLGRLAEQLMISAAQFVALDKLRREIDPAAREHRPAGRRRPGRCAVRVAGRTRRRARLGGRATAGCRGHRVGWCERAAPCSIGAALDAGLEWVASSLSTATLLSEVKESTRRISDLVAAVRSYSQLDRAALQETDLTEGIESTLVMLAHKLEAGSPWCATTVPAYLASRRSPAS